MKKHAIGYARSLPANPESSVCGSRPESVVTLGIVVVVSLLHFLRIHAGAADKWSDTNNGYIVPSAATTQIGIGTSTTPNAMLQIKGKGTTQLLNSNWGFGTLAGNVIAHYLGASGTTAASKNLTVLQVNALGTGAGGNYAAVFTGGNVGVGTLAPSTKLEVAGGGSANGAIKVSGGFFEADGLNANAALNGGTNNLRIGYAVAGKVGFNLQGTERFTILTNGNVGVNVSQIHGGLPATVFEANGNAVEGGSIRITNGYFEVDGVNAAGAAAGGTNNLRIGHFADGRVGFNMQGKEIMSFLRTTSGKGNVGIGTSGPGATLEVAGGGLSNGAIKVSGGFLEVDGVNANGATHGGTNNLRIGYFASGKVGFNLQGTERLTVLTNGNVGVNVSQIHGGLPATVFEANGNGVEGGAIRISNGYFETDGINTAGSAAGGTNNLRVGYFAAGRVGFNMQGREVMTLLNTAAAPGYIGIGTANPGARLEIAGAGTGSYELKVGSGAVAQSASLDVVTNHDSFGFQVWDDNNLVTPRFVVKRTGQVGIGVAIPTKALDVNGDARISGELAAASIRTTSWSIAPPDYVFEKGYKLASLESVETFVNKHKHLPEIPNAKEMKEKGLDLAEINLKLLKKVEELTLYAIEQGKRDRDQAAKIAKLESDLAKISGHSRRGKSE